MKLVAIITLLVFNVQLFSATGSGGKRPKTEWFDCETYIIKSKTLVDSDQNGTYDQVIYTDCDSGDTYAESYKEKVIYQDFSGNTMSKKTFSEVEFWDTHNITNYDFIPAPKHKRPNSFDPNILIYVYDSSSNLIEWEESDPLTGTVYFTRIEIITP